MTRLALLFYGLLFTSVELECSYMSNPEQERPTPLGPKAEAVGLNNWEEMKSKGFEWLGNWPLLSEADMETSRETRAYLEDLAREFGSENLSTGNAMTDSGTPEGIPHYMGVYVRKPVSE